MLTESVLLQIRNGVTSLMQELHYGEGYQYAHDTKEKLTDMKCLPDSLEGREYYTPYRAGKRSKSQRTTSKNQGVQELKIVIYYAISFSEK